MSYVAIQMALRGVFRYGLSCFFLADFGWKLLDVIESWIQARKHEPLHKTQVKT